MFRLIIMAEAHERSKRKSTGGLYRKNSKRKKRNLVGKFSSTVVGEELKSKKKKSRGSTKKVSLRATDKISVSKNGETVEAEIEDVLENSANPDFVRRGVITKGAVLKTSEGKVKVTSRPGQDGTLNGVSVDN